MNETPPTPEQKALLQAAAYMEKHGWCQGGELVNSCGEVCLVGAIFAVTYEGFGNSATCEAPVYGEYPEQFFEDFINSKYGDGYGAVRVNNQVLKSKEEAVALLRMAAGA